MDPPASGFEGDEPVNQYSETPWTILTYDHNGNLTGSEATAASQTMQSLLADPGAFQGVQQSASLDSGSSLDLDNDGAVDATDSVMLAEVMTAGPESMGAPGGGSQSFGFPFCEEPPCEPEPEPCPGDAWFARVTSIQYDWRIQMVRYEADDSRCAIQVHEYFYDALGRRIGRVLMTCPRFMHQSL